MFVTFVVVICSSPRKITIMTQKVAAVPNSLKEPGSTMVVTTPISMVYTLTDHILLLQMESTGAALEDITIH